MSSYPLGQHVHLHLHSHLHLQILSVYMKGSKNMSYDSFNLTTPDIKWLGVRPTDLDKYSIPAQCRLEMTEQAC